MTRSPDDRPRGEVTRLLERASHGNREAFDELFPVVYDELKAIARNRLRSERSGHTLGATALVHEAYLNLVDQERVEWQGRAHFFSVAAAAMRRILIDYARMKKRRKRGGDARHVSVESADEHGELISESQAIELLALDQALDRLRAFNEEGADVVVYRLFGGLTHEEIAEVSGVAEITVRRRWSAARAWLRGQLGTDGVPDVREDTGPDG